MTEESKGKVISVINMKGGVAKTTLTKELGMVLGNNYNKKILFVDIDPQSNLTQSLFEVFNVIDTENIKTVDEMNQKVSSLPSINLLYDNPRTDVPSKDKLILKLNDNIHIVPGSLNSIFYGKSTSGDNEQSLHNFIKRNNIRDDYDLVLIDCPPTYSTYTVSSILSSDFYLIPVKPDAYSALGIDLLNEVIDKIKNTYEDTFSIKPIKCLGIIFTIYKEESVKSTNIKRDIETSKKFENYKKFEAFLPRRDRLSTVKLDYLISTSDDGLLKSALNEIVDEFLKEIDEHV